MEHQSNIRAMPLVPIVPLVQKGRVECASTYPEAIEINLILSNEMHFTNGTPIE